MPKPGEGEGAGRDGPLFPHHSAPSDGPSPPWSVPGPALEPRRRGLLGIIIGMALGAVLVMIAVALWILF